MRSAISLISHNEIGNHPMVRRFCKGVAALKPPRPRYDYVWDPAPVITKLASVYPYERVSLKAITKKLVLLLVLGTGHRAQTLCSLRLSQISLDERSIIRVPNRIKTSAPGRPQLFFCFSRFENHENLCLVSLRSTILRQKICAHLLAIPSSFPYRNRLKQELRRLAAGSSRAYKNVESTWQNFRLTVLDMPQLHVQQREESLRI